MSHTVRFRLNICAVPVVGSIELIGKGPALLQYSERVNDDWTPWRAVEVVCDWPQERPLLKVVE